MESGFSRILKMTRTVVAIVALIEVGSAMLLARQAPAGAAAFVHRTIQESGDYRVEVVRLAPYCLPPFTYLLTITLK